MWEKSSSNASKPDETGVSGPFYAIYALSFGNIFFVFSA